MFKLLENIKIKAFYETCGGRKIDLGEEKEEELEMQKKKEEKMSLLFSFLSYARSMYVHTSITQHDDDDGAIRTIISLQEKRKKKVIEHLLFFSPVTFRVWVIHCRSCPAVHTYT